MLRRFVARNYSDSATGLQQPGKKVLRALTPLFTAGLELFLRAD